MAFDFPASPAVGTIYAPPAGPTYLWDGVSWGVIAATGSQPGSIKIDGGELAAAAAFIQFAMPQSGFSAVELILSRFSCTGGTAISISLDFSWDNAVTFPNAATAYTYSYHWTTTAAGGGPSGGGGQATNNWIFFSLHNTSGVKGQARILLPITAAGELQTMQYDAWHWSGTEYRNQRGAGYAASVSGPPTHARIRCSSATLAAGCRWQLNGFR